MSNPTELPDLYHLEALAQLADQGDGQHVYIHPRDSNRWKENEAWHRAASPAAVLALIALARRAKPEGEAPQAEHPLYTCTGKGGQYEIIGGAIGAGASRHVGSMIVYRDVDSGNLYYRTVSDFNERMEELPSPAAQHAESGAQATDLRKCIRSLAMLVAEEGIKAGSGSTMSVASDKVRAVADGVLAWERGQWLVADIEAAAQQAAAPGFLNNLRDGYASGFFASGPDDADHRFTLHYATSEQAEAAFMAITSTIESSAPGTPEAPADKRWGYRGFYIVQHASGSAITGTYNNTRHPDRTHFVSLVQAMGYIDCYLDERAAQLDGGQEGSESNG